MTSATGGGSGPTQWGRGARAALVVGCAAGYGLLAGVWTPRGPNDAVEALAAMALGLGVGLLAGAVMRSWWAMLVAPVAFVAVFELVRLDASGATIDSITLSSEYGVLAFIVGRVFHGILAVWPLLVGVALGRACARRRPGLDPSAGSWPVRVGGAFRRVAFVVSVAVLLVLAVALVRPASTDPVLDTDGEPLAGSIAELDTASIGGVLLAAIYGALFVYQAVLFVRAGVVGDRLRFSASNGAAGRFGWAAIAYALVAPHVISPPVPDRPRATRGRCRQERRDHAGDTEMMQTTQNEARAARETSRSLPIEVDGLTKRYGEQAVVSDLSFVARPGRVTGFLGPNGSGKSTTMKVMLDLASADGGTATIGGRRYRDLPDPSATVGALLESDAFHPGRSGRNHLRILADADGISFDRVDEVLELVGLADAADRRVGAYSLGMRQRLGFAGALLGDPPVLILDEPANGLDPKGIHEMRDLLQNRAAEGNTVLVSSHLLAEVELLADDVVVVNRGRLVTSGALADLQEAATLVRAAASEQLADLLRNAGGAVDARDGALVVRGLPMAEIGQRAFDAGIALHELSSRTGSLEERFLRWTTAPEQQDIDAEVAS